MKNKRGLIEGVMTFAVIMVTLGIFILLVGYIFPTINEKLRNSDLNKSSASMAALSYGDQFVESFDAVFLIIFIGLIMGIWISAFFIDAHPIFIPIYIILFAMTIIIGAILNNVYEEFAANSIIATTAGTYVFTSAIIEHYVMVLIGVGIVSMILMFGKTRGSRGERI